MSDRHDLWRFVTKNLEAMKTTAPEGYEPIPEVYIAGRDDPIIVGRVETRRDPDWPWVFVLSGERGDDIDEAHRQHKALFVREDLILRVEIAFRPLGGKKPIGFSYSDDLTLEGPASSSE